MVVLRRSKYRDGNFDSRSRMRFVRTIRSSPSSVIALIVVNLFPMFGVLFMGWDVFPIMFLFWSENVIIGFYNVLRMIACQPKEKGSWLAKLFLIPFFIIHYGGFTAGHGFFVITLFGQTMLEAAGGPRLDALLDIIWNYNLPFAMLAIFLSHGYSFITNYLGKGEYRQYTLTKLMTTPYSRVVILHIALVIGGLLTVALESPTVVLLLFILLKIMMDLGAHLREHRIHD